MAPKPDIPRTGGSPSVALADKIVTAIEGHFRDWLMHGEHTEATQLVAAIIDRELDGWTVKAEDYGPNGEIMKCENLDGKCASSWCNCDELRARNATSAPGSSRLKLCKDCKHFDGGDCTRWRFVEPVRGTEIVPRIIASVERSSNVPVPARNTPVPCGPGGKHWEEAPPTPAPLSWWKRALGMSNDGSEPTARTEARTRP